MSLLNQLDASATVSLTGIGIAFAQVSEEIFVPDETGKVLAALLHADASAASHGVSVEQGEMKTGAELVLHLIEEDIACREITMEKSVFVQLCREGSKGLDYVSPFFRFQGHDVCHGGVIL